MTSREIGVIGGVGPAATAEFLHRVVAWTEAATDQDHADLVVLQHSTIPDRTAHIIDPAKPDPGPVLAVDARRLQGLRVGAIVNPCNSSRAYLSQVEDAVDIEVVDIVSAAAEDAVQRFPGASVGVLATTGTVLARSYHAALGDLGVETIVPSEAEQAGLMELIYDQVKAGTTTDRTLLDAAIADVEAQGAGAVILGCTELSVAAAAWELRDNVVDALDSLARRTVSLAGRTVRER